LLHDVEVDHNTFRRCLFARRGDLVEETQAHGERETPEGHECVELEAQGPLLDNATIDCDPEVAELADVNRQPFLLLVAEPSVASESSCLAKRRRGAPPALSLDVASESSSRQPSRRPSLQLDSPSSQPWDSGSPLPDRHGLKCIAGRVDAVFFDFDGTLTATPGPSAMRSTKREQLVERSAMLRPWLQHLVDAGLTLGIISKSSSSSLNDSLESAGLANLFRGPILPKAIGFEGKAGFIEELVQSERLPGIEPDCFNRVLLIDDDVLELDRCREKNIQTYAAPSDGGLQDDDFEEIFHALGLLISPKATAGSHL